VNKFTNALFIYLQTANDGRPRPEEVIGNLTVNRNRDLRTHTYKNITNRQHIRWWSYIKRVGALTKTNTSA